MQTTAAILSVLLQRPLAAPASGEPRTSGATNASAPSDERVLAPALEAFVEAPYPEQALAARVEGRVVLVLTVSAGGEVTEASAVEGLGYGLDEAAEEAALGFRFRPALQDGVARAARIHYAYEFRLPRVQSKPEAESAPAPRSGAEQGGTLRPAPTLAAESSASEPIAPPSSPPELQSEASVEVQGRRVDERLRRSANAVTVVDLTTARRESADVGEVLARTQGVHVQRVGGLGSAARVTLGGFDDHQLRFFLDGVPLEYSGYSFGIQNVPITFAERIDVYKGVVPVRLGADALGGAFDVVTDRATRGTKGALSFQGGSFDTYRLAASGRHLDPKTGLFGKIEAFYDVAQNDYRIEVDDTDDSAQPIEVEARRLHDAYRAVGGNIEAGLVNRRWADRFLLRAFASDYDKELQHNVAMTVPYGEARYGGLSAGGNVRYEQDFGRGVSGSFVTGYAFEQTDFLDVTECIYDWFRQCIFQRRIPGEVGDRPSDRTVWDHTVYGRWSLAWLVAPEHALRYAIAPTFFTRSGEERQQPSLDSRDPLHAEREMLKWINGVEYEARLADGRLQNMGFAKAYLQASQSSELLSAGVDVQRNVQRVYFGAGDGLRYELNDWALGKVSYEYAIRLPEPVELFGNGVQIIDNLVLEPERSHNVNLSFLVEGLKGRLGKFDASLTGFYRGADHLIVLLGRDQVFRYENVYAARSLGVEAAAAWTLPGENWELALNGTYQDVRNVSSEGTFGQFDGDRIPNKPYLFGTGQLRWRERQLLSARDELSLAWYGRYVHQFFRSWESIGQAEQKATIDAQFVQTVVLSYLVSGPRNEEVSFSLEVQNLTDERTFDFYGVQRPGRAFFGKVAATF